MCRYVLQGQRVFLSRRLLPAPKIIMICRSRRILKVLIQSFGQLVLQLRHADIVPVLLQNVALICGEEPVIQQCRPVLLVHALNGTCLKYYRIRNLKIEYRRLAPQVKIEPFELTAELFAFDVA